MAPHRLEPTRRALRINADPTRVIVRPFFPGDDERTRAIAERVLDLPESDVGPLLDDVLRRFESRHRDIRGVLEHHYDLAAAHFGTRPTLSAERRLLIGAYFTNEYSLEAAALFNPSIVPHPDQSGLGSGQVRFILSLRACGEGHVSSIEFRTGVIDGHNDNGLTLDPVGHLASTGTVVEDRRYRKPRFFRKFVEMGAYTPMADSVFDRLEDEFTIAELRGAIDAYRPEEGYVSTYHEMADAMIWLARSNYSVAYPAECPLSERVIFPINENESRGIEDARFVRFVDDDGSVTYYATYTAYNGFRTLPQLLETHGFRQFKIHTLNGTAVQNKGMALFPRRLNGLYWTVSRIDGESIYMLRSETLHFWNEAVRIQTPIEPWECVQIGNCGSPIETEAGWLLLTHGVGPMRQYWIGALLLDLEDPTRVIGRLEEPLLTPDESERDGYVPNVVYSCGGMVHNDELIIPYAVADMSTAIATVPLPELLRHLTSDGRH